MPSKITDVSAAFDEKWVPEPNTGCWLWTHAVNRDGYGHCQQTTYGEQRAHRFSWKREHGLIPHGVELDHKCRQRSCVNPVHLELVTHSTNVRRGTSPAVFHARKTHCPQGHAYDSSNTILYENRRYCAACRSQRDKRRRVA